MIDWKLPLNAYLENKIRNNLCVSKYWSVKINDKKFEYMENVNEVVQTILDNVK